MAVKAFEIGFYVLDAPQTIGSKEKCEAPQTIVNMWLMCCASKHDMRK
jgi:hypothetical protein